MLARLVFNIGQSYDPLFKTVLDYGAAQGYTVPTLATRKAASKISSRFRSHGQAADAEFIYIMLTDGDANFSTLNWIDPTKYKLGKVGAPVFTPKAGWKSAAGGYLKPNFKLLTNCVKASQNDISAVCWINEDFGNTFAIPYGVEDAGHDFYHDLATSFNLEIIRASAASSGASVPLSYTKGLWTMDRNAAAGAHSSQSFYNAGLSIDNNIASASLSALDIFVLGANNGGALDGPLLSNMGFFMLSKSRRAQVETDWEDWMEYLTTVTP